MSFKASESPCLKKQASKMVKGLEVLATKPDDVSLVPKTHMVERELIPIGSFLASRMHHVTCVHTIVYTYKTCVVFGFRPCLSMWPWLAHNSLCKPRLALNSESSVCFCLLNARRLGLSHLA